MNHEGTWKIEKWKDLGLAPLQGKTTKNSTTGSATMIGTNKDDDTSNNGSSYRLEVYFLWTLVDPQMVAVVVVHLKLVLQPWC